MALKLGQSQKVVQRLTFTPQMQQAIHILQLPLIALKQMAQEEMLKNPLLSDEEGELPNDSEEVEHVQSELDGMGLSTFPLDENMDGYFAANEYFLDKEEEQKKRNYRESLISKPPDLIEHLRRQIGISSLTGAQRRIAEEVIGNIDDNGYLRATAEEIAHILNVLVKEVEDVVSFVQMLDPVGVGSYTLRECLLRQLEARGEKKSLAYAIVQNCLEELRKKKYEAIAKNLKVHLDEVKNAIKVIHSLDPKPGKNFCVEQAKYVIPDIVVKKLGDDYEIELNDEEVPNLRISDTYRDLLRSAEISNEVKEYIKKKLSSALWMIKAINQRQQTVLKISSFIVNFQKEALEKGLGSLRPLTIKQIASRVGLHESTVSRAIMNKYIQTPIGIFELKDFLSRRLETETDGTISADHVKAEIKALIQSENSQQSLSDEKIAKVFRERGWNVARRTVAKYREDLGIPTSNLRKREKLLS